MDIVERWITEPNVNPFTGQQMYSFSEGYFAIQETVLAGVMERIKRRIKKSRMSIAAVDKLQTRIFLFHKSQGLINDATLYKANLPGAVETIYHFDEEYEFCGFHSRLEPYPFRTMNIYLESLPRDPQTFLSAGFNFFMVNPEIGHDPTFYDLLDGIICKTHHAGKTMREICAQQNSPTVCLHTSHDSPDMYDPTVKKDYNAFLHVGGISKHKQTDVVIETWVKNPGFPPITIVARHPQSVKRLSDGASMPDNIRFIDREISLDELTFLMNRNGCHICPSLTEGWGHYLNEARSCQSVIITNEAPPMSEFIAPDFGVLAPSTRGERKGYQYKYPISVNDLSLSVERVIRMTESQKRMMGEKARQAYIENKTVFKDRFPSSLIDVISNSLLQKETFV